MRLWDEFSPRHKRKSSSTACVLIDSANPSVSADVASVGGGIVYLLLTECWHDHIRATVHTSNHCNIYFGVFAKPALMVGPPMIEMLPPGYEIITEGVLQDGDIFFSAQYDFDGEWLKVMESHIGKPVPKAISIARKVDDGVTGYYSCIERSPGAYETVACHDDIHPHHDELLDLANKFGKKVVLMKSQIVDEAEPND